MTKGKVVLEAEEDLGFRDIGVPLKERDISIKQDEHNAEEDTLVPGLNLPLNGRRLAQSLPEDSEDSEKEEDKAVPRRVVRSTYRGQFGAVLRRQIDEPWQPGRRGRVPVRAG